MGIKSLAKKALTQKENLRYRFLLAKRQCSYEEWLERQKLIWQEENDKAIPADAGDGDYVFLCASKGVMTSCARRSILCYFRKHPEVRLLYGDEDVQGEGGKPTSPVFKPDWSPDVLDGCFYFGSLVAMRKELFLEAAEEMGTSPLLRTMKENDYLVTDFPEYVRWMRRCVELTDGYRKGSCQIGHVAQILFHCESVREITKFEKAPKVAVAEKGTAQIQAEREDAAGNPVVSVIIPSKDHPELLEKCLNGVRDTAEGLEIEIIVVDNGSSAENRERTEQLAEELTEEKLSVFYLYAPMGFHFSKMCNLGAEKARGQFLLFLNDDVELAVQGCIEGMAALAARPYTGAVGMKLYYPDSVRIQHAGITNLPMGPVHKLQFHEDIEAPESLSGIEGAAVRHVCENNREALCFSAEYMSCRRNANYLAVTAACLMVERSKFQEAGRFSDELPVAFNDVELCFKLYEAGYRNVCMNGCHAYHHESLSRGDDESVEKLERLLEERDKLYGAHPGMEGADPYYSVHLNREGLDTKIRPAYETAGNTIQEYDKFLAEKTFYDCRRDECVMVRIEAVRSGEIYGWSVVLGDNNACYEKFLMLKKVTEAFSAEAIEWYRGPNGVYAIPLEGQYRPDLQENMPDQKNVALGGFHVRLKMNLLPPGRYRLGVTVRHRISGAMLMNWSNRCVEL